MRKHAETDIACKSFGIVTENPIVKTNLMNLNAVRKNKFKFIFFLEKIILLI